MPSPTIASDKKEGDPNFPVTGGIGYGVNKASKNIDLAIELNKEFATAANQQIFFQDAGAIPANTKVDISGLKSPSGKLIFGWMKTSEAPMAYSDATAPEVEELHRQSQLMLNGEASVDQAAARLDEVQAQARRSRRSVERQNTRRGGGAPPRAASGRGGAAEPSAALRYLFVLPALAWSSSSAYSPCCGGSISH